MCCNIAWQYWMLVCQSHSVSPQSQKISFTFLSIHPSIHPFAVLKAGNRGQSPLRQSGRQCSGWVSWLTGTVLSCQTPCWIGAYTTMVRVEYTCSFLLKEKKRKMWIVLLCFLYKLLRHQAGLKASRFMAPHYFLGLVWLSAFVCCVFVFSSCSANIWWTGCVALL